MSLARQRLTVRVYTSYASTRALVSDLSDKWSALTFSTALHGGFADCVLTVPSTVPSAWQALKIENRPGWHFYHLEIAEDQDIVWEGRIMRPGFRAGRQGLDLVIPALGYWSSCRDQGYSASDSGSTNWAAGGPHYHSDVIAEVLTNRCPDINTDQSNITAGTRDIVGVVLTTRKYLQNIIIDDLAPLADTSGGEPWYFAIWENRLPYWAARNVTSVDWTVKLEQIDNFEFVQDATTVRQRIYPVAGTTEGTAVTNTNYPTNYPMRDAQLTLPSGAPSGAQSDAATARAAQLRLPRQSQGMMVNGRVYSNKAVRGLAGSAGIVTERPKWWIRAGQVIRIEDLIPPGVPSAALDDLRTFWIRETIYDGTSDTLIIQPDTISRSLDNLLPRIGTLEAA